MNIVKIISGGQTGADQGGLLAARDLNIPTGGVAPRHYRTENGFDPWLADYGLVEGQSPRYDVRTAANIRAADVTIIFGKSSTGSRLTSKLCITLSKPYIWVRIYDLDTAVDKVYTFLSDYSIPLILNIAGNRESISPGIQERVRSILKQVILKDQLPR